MKPVAVPIQGASCVQQGYDMVYGYSPYTFSPFRFLAQPLGKNYQYFSHRLLMYLSFAGIFIISTFLIVGAIDKLFVFVRHLPFICTMALHMACVFTISHILADMVAHQLKHYGMAYGSRTVGSQWIVLYGGLLLGFCIHHVVFPKLLILCGMDSSIPLTIDLWIVPLWCASIYSNLFTVLINLKSQTPKQVVTYEQKRAPISLTGSESKQLQNSKADHLNQTRQSTTTFRINGFQKKISLKSISHASMEDHYCRVFYQDGQQMENILVRQSLKQLMNQLGQNDFIRIHRSHIVNKQHIREYKRKGRNHLLQLDSNRFVLPVSRRRQGKVRKAIAR